MTTSTRNFWIISLVSLVVDSVEEAIAHINRHPTGHAARPFSPPDLSPCGPLHPPAGQRRGLRQRLHPVYRRGAVRPGL
ncbi:MAG: hypothetical protein ACLT9P_03930 [Evtepia gabavorous]